MNRKKKTLRKNAQQKYYIGIDVGGTKIVGGLVDDQGNILSRVKYATPLDGSGAKIDRMTKTVIRQLLEEIAGIGVLRGIGIGIPGIIAPNNRDILTTPNVKLTKYPLVNNLEKAFKTKVILGNDVNLGLLGEKWLGAGKNAKNVVGLFPGTGVGGAIIINGSLVTGSQGAAAELGHMIMDMHSHHVNAGVRGSLEALAGRRAIERDIKTRIRKGEKTVITLLQKKNIRTIKSGVFAQALKKKDKLTVSVIQEACQCLGKACISIRHILNPDMIIFGGGLLEACGGYMLPRIRRISSGDPFFKGIDRCRIEQSVLGDDSIIYGAVALLKQNLGEKISGKISPYPQLKIGKGGRVQLAGKLIVRNAYIRADGKLRVINGASGFEELKKGVLDVSALKKICKKSPRVLIVSSPGDSVRIVQEAREFLKKRDIILYRLKVREALNTYNATEGRKALVIMYYKEKRRGRERRGVS